MPFNQSGQSIIGTYNDVAGNQTNDNSHHFTISGGQFIYNPSLCDLESTLNQNATITYEKIRLATPIAPTVFTGRNELIAEAVQELCQNHKAHIAILGAGGLGKTALALHISKAEAVKQKFGDKIYFVPCELFSDTSSLIQGLVQSLKLSVTKGNNPYEIFEKHLELCQNPMLIILDNFETPWHGANDQNFVLNLIDQIMGQELVSILLTMRASDGPGYQKWHKIGGHSGLPTLDLDAARQAFMLISNSQSEDVEKLNWLLEEIDCMPLAILLVAQLKKHLSLDTLIRKWKVQKTKMLKIGVAANRQTNLSTSIDISLEIVRGSHNDCLKILPILSFLPNGVPSWEETLGKLIVEPSVDLEVSVISLCELALIYEENNGIKMLSPIREDLKNKYPTQAEHLRQIASYYVRLLSYYSGGKGQDIIEQHSSNITKILATQLQKAPDKEYLAALYEFTKYTKFSSISVGLIDIALTQRWDDGFEEEIRLRFLKEGHLGWIGDYERGVAEIEAIQLRLKDVDTQLNGKSREKVLAMCNQSLGNICVKQAEYLKAKLLLIDAKTQFEKIGHQLETAQCLHSLGDICHMQAEYSEAKLLLTDAKTQFEEICDQSGAVQCLQSLADICYMQGEYPEAKLLLIEAKTQFDEIGYQPGAIECLQSLGKICYMQAKYSDAKVLLTDAKTQFEKIGYQLGAVQCLRSLGKICHMQTEHSEAKLLLTDAKNQFEKIGHQLGAAQCLQSLGDICYMQGELSDAKLLFMDAKIQFEKIGDQPGAALCLQRLGDICHIQAEYPEAKSLLTDAKTQFERIGYQPGAVECLQGLGNICHMQAEYSEAKLLLTDAKTQFETIGYSLGAVQCLQSLGKIRYMQGEYSEAKFLLTEAKTQFENIGHQLGTAQCLHMLGGICHTQGEYSEANLFFIDAKTRFEKIGHQLGVAMCLQSQGNICYLQVEYSEAKLFLTDAKAQFEKIGDQSGTAQCIQSLGNICYMQGDYSEAKLLHTNAKIQFEKIGYQVGAEEYLQSLGKKYHMHQQNFALPTT